MAVPARLHHLRVVHGPPPQRARAAARTTARMQYEDLAGAAGASAERCLLSMQTGHGHGVTLSVDAALRSAPAAARGRCSRAACARALRLSVVGGGGKQVLVVPPLRATLKPKAW